MVDRAGSLLPASRTRKWESPAAGLLVAVVCVALATALVYPLRIVAPPVSAGVVYMLAVLVVSTYWGLWPGLFASVAGALAFNFFHLPPEGTLDVAKGENWVALALFLVVALIASSVAEQSRARARATIEAESLRRSDEAKTTLLRAVSHDLRSPLTAIVAAADALGAERISAADRVALAAAVADEAARLSRLIDKLLDLSRLEAGQARPNADWCAIDEVVTAAIDELGARGERVRVAIEDGLPFVRADAAQLERAVANLVENALRFSPGEPVVVQAHRAGKQLLVRVVDHGPGIPAPELDRVFEPFYQRPGDPVHDGAGLGLAIVRGLVEINGGQVHAEPGDGHGAAFEIALPVEIDADAAAPAEKAGLGRGEEALP
jgi:two-component system sensor histidine kinase KdpD